VVSTSNDVTITRPHLHTSLTSRRVWADRRFAVYILSGAGSSSVLQGEQSDDVQQMQKNSEGAFQYSSAHVALILKAYIACLSGSLMP
jgi:hypothetical protein